MLPYHLISSLLTPSPLLLLLGDRDNGKEGRKEGRKGGKKKKAPPRFLTLPCPTVNEERQSKK
jgi:hypothetical protein